MVMAYPVKTSAHEDGANLTMTTLIGEIAKIRTETPFNLAAYDVG